MSDVISIANEIEKKIHSLEKIRGVIRERGDQKATTISEYEKVIAITIIKLKNGYTLKLDGQEIENPAATFTEKIARGICWQEKLEMEKAEASYKSAIVNMNSIQAELNALQSIYRHLENK